MKVLTIIDTLGYGGAERLLVSLLPELQKQGVICEVAVANAPYSLKTELEQAGIKVHCLDISHRWAIPEAAYKLAKICKKNQFDIIWGNLYFGILYSRLTSLFFPSVKVISVLHCSISSDSIKKGLWYSFRNWVFNKSKNIDFITIAVSKSVKKDYEEFFKWNAIDVIYNAIDLKKIDNAIFNINVENIRYKYNLLLNDYIIVLPGRLHKSKGHKYLIEAINILKHNYHIYPKIFFAGEGSLKNDIKNHIIELRLENQFILTGNLNQIELFKILKASDLIIIPSLFEAFGIAAIEAMYLETPLIVTEIDGLKEITTNNINAIHVPVKNPNAIADAVIKIINNPIYTKNLVKNAKETVSIYDTKIIAKQWIQIFKNGEK